MGSEMLPHRPSRRPVYSLLVALGLMSFAAELWAFQPCPGGTHPCASPLQVLLWIILPSFVLFGCALLARRKIRRTGLRYVAIALVGGLWLFWLLAIYFAFNAFLALCSGDCWLDVFR